MYRRRQVDEVDRALDILVERLGYGKHRPKSNYVTQDGLEVIGSIAVWTNNAEQMLMRKVPDADDTPPTPLVV